MAVHVQGPYTSRPDFAISDWVDYMLEPHQAAHRYWFALNGSTAVGGLKLSLVGGPTARDVTGDTVGISDLSVEPKFQRQGVATVLMQACEAWVKPQPDLPPTVSLGVETDNQAALALYAKQGYRIAERQSKPITFSGNDGKPCFVMYKRLR